MASKEEEELKPESTQSDDKEPLKTTKATVTEETEEHNVALEKLANTPIQLVRHSTPQTPAPKTESKNAKTEDPKTEKTPEKPPKEPEKLIEVPSDEVGRVENNIDNLPFYHGFMGRMECESMLSDHGDFLIRKTEVERRDAFVISIRWNYRNVHVLVKRTKTKKLYWTKKYAFRSVCELIAYHKQSHKPIFEEMILMCGLARHGWQLNNEQVHLDKKLGEGQFGEVHKGTLKTSIFTSPVTVAVKTLHQNHLTANEKILFLKEANVMLTLAHLKISDFGLSVKGVAIKERKGGCLPVKYMAPETLKKGLYSTASDIYSYGALIYEVYTDGKTPFEACGLRGNELRKAIISEKVVLKLEANEATPPFILTIFEQSRLYSTQDRMNSKKIIETFKEETGMHEVSSNPVLSKIGEYFSKLRPREKEQEAEPLVANS
uniref:Tyrosine-protein kinase n=1 Tax=Caenorhabditis tropicalis TaxID=1561998 RepID=A0A1I7THM9_9PELO